jgi:hypothetical protein
MPHQNADAKGAPEVLYSFAGSPDGAQPWSGIVFNRDLPNIPHRTRDHAQGRSFEQ